MSKRTRNDWSVRVHGAQREDIELDLLAQIIVMLGWQLHRETLTDEGDPADSHD